MKIETLVDVINYEHGEWGGCDGNFNFVANRPFHATPTYYRDRPSGVSWTREEFENEVAELSAAAWIFDRTEGGEITPIISFDQLHQPESSGGSCGYYKCEITSPTTEPEAYTAECNDLIEALDMTYAEANIFKEIWRTCAARKGKVKEGHQSTRGAEKVLFFAVRNAIQKDADVSQIISNINKG